MEPAKVVEALNSKLRERGLRGSFTFDEDTNSYYAHISTDATDYQTGQRLVETALGDLTKVLPIGIASTMRGSSPSSPTAKVSLHLRDEELQRLLTHPLPSAAEVLGFTAARGENVEPARIVETLNNKLRERGLRGSFTFDEGSNNYYARILTDATDWQTGQRLVETALGDLTKVLPIGVASTMRGSQLQMYLLG